MSGGDAAFVSNYFDHLFFLLIICHGSIQQTNLATRQLFSLHCEFTVVLLSESQCKGSHAPSVRSPVVDEEWMKTAGDFSWFLSVL